MTERIAESALAVDAPRNLVVTNRVGRAVRTGFDGATNEGIGIVDEDLYPHHLKSSASNGSRRSLSGARLPGGSSSITLRTSAGSTGTQPALSASQCRHVDSEAVPNVRLQHACIGVVDLLDADDLNVCDDVVLATEIEHLLGFGDAADRRT